MATALTKRKRRLDRDFAAGAAEPRRIEGGLLCSNKAINCASGAKGSSWPKSAWSQRRPWTKYRSMSGYSFGMVRALFDYELAPCRPSHPNRAQSRAQISPRRSGPWSLMTDKARG